MNSHIKHIIVAVLAAAMLLSCMTTAFAYSTADVVKAAEDFIFRNEGYYHSILANDNGAVSLGRIGWHAGRALYLLRMIVEKDEEEAQSLLSEELYEEITDPDTDWTNRILTQAECVYVAALLSTEQSKQAQDELAYNDILGYVNGAKSLGVTDPKALVFFCDLNNQLGFYGAKAKVDTALELFVSSASQITLDVLYNASIVETTSAARRLSCYEYCKSLSFSGYSDPDPDSNADSNTQTGSYSTGIYRVTANPSLRVRSGPGTGYSTVTDSVPYGTSITVTQVSGSWGKITYKGVTGWVSLQYASYQGGADVNGIMLGDVNADGKVTAVDARLALRMAASLQSTTLNMRTAGDVDKDGHVTASDARKILRVSAKIDSF